jgi:hypothetical protein
MKTFDESPFYYVVHFINGDEHGLFFYYPQRETQHLLCNPSKRFDSFNHHCFRFTVYDAIWKTLMTTAVRASSPIDAIRESIFKHYGNGNCGEVYIFKVRGEFICPENITYGQSF